MATRKSLDDEDINPSPNPPPSDREASMPIDTSRPIKVSDPYREAIEQWILAEYHFRYGPWAFTDRTTNNALAASAALCRVVTGKDDIAAAGLSLAPQLAALKAKKRAYEDKHHILNPTDFGMNDEMPPAIKPPRRTLDDDETPQPAPTTAPAAKKRSGLFG